MGLSVIACLLAASPGVVGPRGGVLTVRERFLVPGRRVEIAFNAPQTVPLGRSGGNGFLGVSSAVEPANCDLAVGPTAIVQTVNGRLGIFSKSGQSLYEADAAAFFGGLAFTPSPREPRAMYDPRTGRFFVLFNENDAPTQTGNFLLAVSDDSDPEGTWFQYKFPSTFVESDVFWSKRPALGASTDGIAITTTVTRFFDNSERGSSFYVVHMPELLVGAPLHVSRLWDEVSEFAQVAETGPLPSLYMFAIAQTDTDAARVYRISNIASEVPFVRFHDSPAINAPLPPLLVPSTGGASLETHRDEVSSVDWRQDRLLVAWNSLANQTLCGVRWHVYDTSDPMFQNVPVIASGLVSSPTLSYFVPAVGLNKWLDAAVTFSGSSTSLTSDLFACGRMASDVPTVMSLPVSLASASGSPYIGSKWGTYFGATVDAADDETFWCTAMTVAGDGWWQTHIVPFQVTQTLATVPSAYQWLRGLSVSGGLGSLSADDGDYLVARAGFTLSPSEPPAQLVVESVAPGGQVVGLGFDLVSRVNTPGLAQRVELFNFSTGTYVPMGAVGATTGDSLQSVSVASGFSDYVQPGTGLVRAKVLWYRTGLTLLWPWSVSVDQARWRVRTRV
jgi:hypothetical protein